MRIKAKLRRIGNSTGVILPKEVITGRLLGEVIELDVITEPKKEADVITGSEQKVITQFEHKKPEFDKKLGVWKL